MPVDAASALYEPINAYKPFAQHIGIADGPFEYVRLLGVQMPWRFTTRMTVVQLASGELFLHSPIAFDAALAEHLQSSGRVRHLVSPNRGHYAHIGEWERAFCRKRHSKAPKTQFRAQNTTSSAEDTMPQPAGLLDAISTRFDDINVGSPSFMAGQTRVSLAF